MLAGAIGGLLARGLPALQAAARGVQLHALAAEELGPAGFLAGQLSYRFPHLVSSLTER